MKRTHLEMFKKVYTSQMQVKQDKCYFHSNNYKIQTEDPFLNLKLDSLYLDFGPPFHHQIGPKKKEAKPIEFPLLYQKRVFFFKI